MRSMMRSKLTYVLILLLGILGISPFVVVNGDPLVESNNTFVSESELTAPVCRGASQDDNYSKTCNCQLWLAPSAFKEGSWGVFAGSDMNISSWLGVPELLVPIFDVNMNEFRPWHDVVWSDDFLGMHPLYLESYYENRMFVPGLAMHVQCPPMSGAPIHLELRREDVAFTTTTETNAIHRSTSPLAGAFSEWHNFTSRLVQTVQEGEELFVDCGYNLNAGNRSEFKSVNLPAFRQEEAACLFQTSSLEVQMTNASGHGLATLRKFHQGEVIATTPLLVIDRSQMEIVHQYPTTSNLNGRPIRYTEHGVGMQLLLNYAYGHENSTILLVPTGIGVNFINHHATNANAYIRWSTSPLHRHGWIQNYSAMDLLLEGKPGLLMDFVALKDIEPGEEILVNYGPAWERAWQEHVTDYFNEKENKGYISATDYLHFNENNDLIRTKSEQLDQPYPDNIQTACYYEHVRVAETQNAITTWSEDNFACLRPCDLQAREPDADGRGYWYTAVMLPIVNSFAPGYCSLPDHSEALTVTRIPHYAVALMDREYTSDLHLRKAFRHEIGVPHGFFPDAWMVVETLARNDFDATPLQPYELKPIQWKETRATVTTFGYRMGLDKKLPQALKDFANRMGIIDFAKTLTIQGNALRPDSNRTIQTEDGRSWFIQRPKSSWKSNMHWISPADEITHDDFIRVLGDADFDEIMKVIGNFFQLDGLVCYHATFIAVSHCSRGYVHYDFTGTGGKAFNIIVPIMLVNDTAPELELWDFMDHAKVGRYQYEHAVAAIMGDDAFHATAAVDYRLRKEMRLAATLYVADVNQYNAHVIMNDFTQAFPPKGDPQFLLNWAGKHWKRNDPTARILQNVGD